MSEPTGIYRDWQRITVEVVIVDTSFRHKGLYQIVVHTQDGDAKLWVKEKWLAEYGE